MFSHFNETILKQKCISATDEFRKIHFVVCSGGTKYFDAELPKIQNSILTTSEKADLAGYMDSVFILLDVNNNLSTVKDIAYGETLVNNFVMVKYVILLPVSQLI